MFLILNKKNPFIAGNNYDDNNEIKTHILVYSFINGKDNLKKILFYSEFYTAKICIGWKGEEWYYNLLKTKSSAKLKNAHFFTYNATFKKIDFRTFYDQAI